MRDILKNVQKADLVQFTTRLSDKSNTSATQATRMQDEQHKCDTSATRTTQVLHKRQECVTSEKSSF